MKNILITGSRGFIGRNLKEYLEGKYNIFSPMHSELDLLDEYSVKQYIKENSINIIVHAANTGGNRKHIDGDIVNKNLRMFFNIDRCSSMVEKIIHLGSGAEYDKSRPLSKVSETEFDEFVPKDDYGYSKYIISKYIEKANNIVCLRLFGVFGKYEDYEYKFISNCVVKNLLKMPIQINQNVYFDYLYINDCTKVIHWFLENQGDYKFYNLCSGQSIDLYNIALKVNESSNFKSDISINNKDLNLEYTADNSRLIKQIPELKFTPMDESIKELFKYYELKLDDINQEVIKKDEYAKKCVVR